MPQTVFLLSPAHCGGRRALMLMRPGANFPLAVRLRESGAPLGEVFQFMSGLYFRGKLAYSTAFGARRGGSAALVIAPGRGLEPAERVIGLPDLIAMAQIPVAIDDPRYREPLERDARALAGELGPDDRVVLLGSSASDKYSDVLERILPGLRFPESFVGRGDMSRGGLMLRCAQDGRELETTLLAGAVRHGPRPPRLEPLPTGPGA